MPQPGMEANVLNGVVKNKILFASAEQSRSARRK
jgi:hypothetical protein